RINQPNLLVVGDVLTDDGQQRNQGVELSWYGEPIPGLRALGGLTWLNAELNKTQGGVDNGKPVIGVPENQASFGLEWDVPALPGLSLDARASYSGAQYADIDKTM